MVMAHKDPIGSMGGMLKDEKYFKFKAKWLHAPEFKGVVADA